jgi:glycine dehydrogenase subunit 2
MTLHAVGRPTRPVVDIEAVSAAGREGHGLVQDEPLIFELGGWAQTGVDLPEPELDASDLAGLTREAPIGLPGLSEPETLRHYVRLSQKNHAIDLAIYPLGSCTMKHNPRLNEKMARLPGFADIHPLQPQSTVQGALALMDELAHWLKTLTGMPAVALSPKAGFAACSPSARRTRRAAMPGARCWRRSRPTAPTPPPPPWPAIRWWRSPRPRTAASTSPTSPPSSDRTSPR